MQYNRTPPQRVRYSFGGPTTPTVKLLLIIIGAVFFLQIISREMFGVYLELWFGVVPYDVTHRFFFWQPFTYLFLHEGLLHIGFNLLVLWMFGCELERVWGRRFFLKYLAVCGVGAGCCIVLVSPSSFVITIGASGALYGILLAYGLLFPNRQILLWFILPIRAKHFVIFIGLLSFYFTLTQGSMDVRGHPGDKVSHLAHLSGLLIGYVYLRGWGHYRTLHRRYLEWKLKRLKKKYKIVDGGKDQDKPPYVH